MAKYTKTLALTASWQALSAGGETVLVQVDPNLGGRVVLAVVDALGDADAVVGQHYLTQRDNPVANFFNLAGRIVVAKKLVTAETPSVTITEY